MLSSVQDVYCRAVRTHFKDFAHWFTEAPPKIGDYGIINGDKFIKSGNIFDENPHLDKKIFDIQDSSVQSGKQYFNNGCKIEPKLQGELIAEVDINFAYENAVFFYSQFSKLQHLQKTRLFGIEVIKYARSFWDKNYAIVTAITYGKNTTICASTHRNTSVTLGISKENLTSIDLSNFGGKLSIKASVSVSQTGVLTQDIEDEVPILLQLYQIKSSFWKNGSFDRLQLPTELLEESMAPEIVLKKLDVSEDNFSFVKI